MRLKSLQLKDFLSHRDTELEFRPEQRLLVDGKSGSGKSALCGDAVVWALYGVGRADNRRLVRHGADETSVVLTLEDGARTWEVTRAANRTGKHRLTVCEDGKPVETSGLKETQELIEKSITGSSHALFVNSVVHTQDGKESFVRQPAKKRKEIILELSRSQDHGKWYDVTRKTLSDTTSKLEVTRKITDVLQAKANNAKESSARLGELEDLKNVAASTTANAEVQARKKEKMSYEMASIKERCENRRNLINEYASLCLSAKERKDEAELSLADLPDVTERAQKARKAAEGLDEDRRELREMSANESAVMAWTRELVAIQSEEPADQGLEQRISELNDQTMALLRKKVQVCPEIGRPCVLFDNERKTRLAELEERVAMESDRLATYRKNMLAHSERLDVHEKKRPSEPDREAGKKLRLAVEDKERALSEALKLETGTDTARLALERELAAVNARIEDLKANHDEAVRSYEELRDRYTEMATEFRKMDGVEDRYREKKTAFLRANEAYILAKNAKERYDEVKEELDKHDVERHELEHRSECLGLLQDALKPTGLTAMVIDHVVPQLENRANEILSRLSDFRLRIDTQRGGVGKGTVCEGLFLSVINGQGEELDFDNYSGGEKMKIKVAISEGLAEMQKAEFRILDESFVGLDTESVEKFSEIMATVGDRFSQLVCVSHIPSLKEQFNEKVTVTKSNGVSKVS